MDLGLKGKRVLVTGGSRGIGLAMVEQFVAEGAQVALCARGEPGVTAVVNRLQATGAHVSGEAFDVRDPVALQGWVDRSIAKMGGLDVVVSNVSTRPTARGIEMWEDGFGSDLLHHVRLTEMTLPALKQGTAANIVFIASIASVMTNLPPIEEAYGAMKAGLINYTGQLAARMASHGVRVNAVSPGPIFFEGGEWDLNRVHKPQLFAMASRLPALGRLGTPQEVANAVVFMASPAASYITGANLRIDGGAVKTSNF